MKTYSLVIKFGLITIGLVIYHFILSILNTLLITIIFPTYITQERYFTGDGKFSYSYRFTEGFYGSTIFFVYLILILITWFVGLIVYFILVKMVINKKNINKYDLKLYNLFYSVIPFFLGIFLFFSFITFLSLFLKEGTIYYNDYRSYLSVFLYPCIILGLLIIPIIYFRTKKEIEVLLVKKSEL